MKKVGFFRSIQFKLVLIYALLLLIAMEVIGAYFVRQLENTLLDNFQTSIEERVDLLAYYLSQEMARDRSGNEELPSIEEVVNDLLKDFNRTEDILEVRVIDGDTLKILGTSDPYNLGVVGQRTTDRMIWRVIASADEGGDNEILIDRQTGNRIWKLVVPVKDNNEVIGAIYLTSNLENAYSQIQTINNIFISGTFISLVITAILMILLSRMITKPIIEMGKHANMMAKGNFSRKVKVYGNDEIGELASTFNNLTKKLQEAQSTTEGEKRKLSSILANMTDGVIATDRKGRVIIINEPAERMLNVSRETILSTPIVSLLGIEGEYDFEDLINTRESIILNYSTATEPYVLRANLSVIQRETGFVNGLIAVLHDITEQEKIDMERREFVANVSHELRTPLTTMRSYLEALAEGAWKDERIAPKFLKVAQNETERMIRLVKDLLKLSKMDSKDYQLNTEWINFIDFYHRVIDRFELIKNEDIKFVRKLPKRSMFVEMDEDKITQVLDNIISNALKYSPEGGKITFEMKKEDNYIIASVSDEGMGIPREKLDKIFERFYRVDKARSRKLGGTGLGLAIAKEMVEAHGGKIWADSIEGHGTTISFSLPYHEIEEDDWS